MKSQTTFCALFTVNISTIMNNNSHN